MHCSLRTRRPRAAALLLLPGLALVAATTARAQTVSSTNHAPTARDDYVAVAPGTSVTLPDLAANDEDPDGDPLSPWVRDHPSFGSLQGPPRRLVYRAWAQVAEDDIWGRYYEFQDMWDRFTYEVFDPHGASAQATVVVRIKPFKPQFEPADWHVGRARWGDFDGDGRLDPAAWTSAPGGAFAGASVALNRMRPHRLNAYASGVQVGDGRLEAIGDFDGDGRDDLLFQLAREADASGPDAVEVWLSRSHPGDREASFTAGPRTPSLHVAAVADLNGDGQADIIGSDGVAFGHAGDFSDPAGRAPSVATGPTPFPHPYPAPRVAFGDVHGDGRTDIVTTRRITRSWTSGGVTTDHEHEELLLWRNLTPRGAASPVFADPVVVATTSMDQHWDAFAVGDVDGDGRSDIVFVREWGGDPATNRDDGWVYVLRNEGVDASGAVKLRAPEVVWDVGPHTRGAAVADVNGDGRMDLVVTASPFQNWPPQIQVLYQIPPLHGAMRFASPSQTFIPAGVIPVTPVVADLDGDGWNDLAVGGAIGLQEE